MSFIDNWLQKSDQSPITRTIFDRANLQFIPNYNILNITQQFPQLKMILKTKQWNTNNTTNIQTEIPTNVFICPLSHKLLTDPIIARNGISYDRTTFLQLHQKHALNLKNDPWISDSTTKYLNFTAKSWRYYPNYLLKSMIEQFLFHAQQIQYKHQNNTNHTIFIPHIPTIMHKNSFMEQNCPILDKSQTIDFIPQFKMIQSSNHRFGVAIEINRNRRFSPRFQQYQTHSLFVNEPSYVGHQNRSEFRRGCVTLFFFLTVIFLSIFVFVLLTLH